MGRKTQVIFYGDEQRFDDVANFVYERFGNSIKYIADVAGGQGMLTRILSKRYNYECEVIDPKIYQLKGVNNRHEEYTKEMASYYDLIIGLHPDEAIREVVESSLVRPVLVLPCCNFWDREQKLGTKKMIEEITRWLEVNNVKYEIIVFDFKGPKNIGILANSNKVRKR